MTKPAALLTPPDPQDLESPPHYTIGKNPHLTAFVEAHRNQDERESIPAYTASKVGTKTSQLYGMHTYWSKKPYEAIEPYIMHYTKPNDIVLDPFSGSGSTALAAVMNKRNTIAIDLSPAATFITYHYTHPIDAGELRAAYGRLMFRIGNDLDWLYETKVNGQPSQTVNTTYSETIKCPSCEARIVVSEADEVNIAKLDRRGNVVMKDGAQVLQKKLACTKCGFTFTTRELGKYQRLAPTPVAVSVYVAGIRIQRKPTGDDLAKLYQIAEKNSSAWMPNHKFPRGERYYKDGLALKAIDKVTDPFTKRSVLALALLFQGIEFLGKNAYTQYLRFAVSSMLLKASELMALNNDGIGRIQKGTYYVAPKRLEINVHRFLEDTIGDLVRVEQSRSGAKYAASCISTQSATDLSNIPSKSIDYVFTDPPYAGQVQYGELNFVWEAWLNLPINWHAEEIIENKTRGKGLDDWKRLMIQAFSEVFRVLKPGRWCTLTYHDTDPNTWELLHNIMREAGFVPDDADKVVSISTSQKSLNQMFANKNAQTDLVVNFYKPRYEGDRPPTDSIRHLSAQGAGIEEQVMRVVLDHLEVHPGQTKAQVYDAVISRLVRSGQIRNFDFEAVLKRNGSLLWVLDGLYYLPGQEVPLDTNFLDWEGITDDKPERKVVAFITRFLGPGARSYSDILAAYTTNSRLSTVRTELNDVNRNLDSLLEEGFVFEDGKQRWRNPNDEERGNLQALTERKRERRVRRWLEICRQGRTLGVLASGDLLWELQRRYEEKDFTGILEVVGYAERSGPLADEAQDYVLIARSIA